MWLEELYVLPEYRMKGIGTNLLLGVMNAGIRIGAKAVDLEIDESHERASHFISVLDLHPSTGNAGQS